MRGEERSSVMTIREGEVSSQVKARARGVVTTLAGNGTAAAFHYPVSIATDQSFLYVTGTMNAAVSKINVSTKAVTSTNTPGADTRIALADGYIYISKTGNAVVIAYTGEEYMVIAGNDSSEMTDDTGLVSQLNASNGHLYINGKL
jgi:DNA-binding beta-propeller fold protein YncE